MERKMIRTEDFNINIFDLLNRRWMLLTAGSLNDGKFNTMTISWGLMGTFWSKPIVMVGVRPQRHTFQFIEKYDTFTLCAFPEKMREKLAFCGSQSGRDVDKISVCELTPARAEYVDAPAFKEAELVIECKKLYAHSISPKNMMAKMILKNCYAERDFHKLYMAEVQAISGVPSYRRSELV